MSETKYLFDAASSGGRDAFDQLVEQFRPRLSKFCRSRLRDGLREWVTVEDVVQEVALKAFQSIDGVQWRGDNALFSWFCGVAQNVIYSNSSRYLRINELHAEGDQPDDVGTSPSQNARREERFDRLERSMSSLTDEQQQVIRLTRIERLPVREVAARMDRSEKATYQLLWRAMKKLREVFGETGSLRLPSDRNLVGPQPLKPD